MKKIVIISIALILGFSLVACSVDPVANVEKLKDWSFQYNQGTNDFSLFFGFSDQDGQAMAADAKVDVRIENSYGEVVFEATKSVTEKDFDFYSSQARGERFLANLRIPASEISRGKSTGGTVYFTVYQDEAFIFDECNCEILYDLPIKDFNVVAELLPVEINIYSYRGSIQSTIRIDSIVCEAETLVTSLVKIIISGEKTYGDGAGFYDVLNYKLYDAEGFVVDSGSVFLNSLSSGDLFRDDSIVLYDLIPGEAYTIKFTD